ncbi:MAG: hypothetical protein HC874_31435 [Richelia sp. SL_2_1]|nr:hypothetical protein [Richelia sp. SM1_7_0]NJO31567.1 hypothetical protein [Richelia sp. SL_2_1]
MKQEIRQSRIRNQLKLESKGIKYQLWRLDDTEEQKLRDNSLPIDDDYMFYIQLDWSDRGSKNKLNLAEVFITLEWLFGKTSDFYDEGKGSFRFPVLLIIEKTIGIFYYLMVIADHRGTVYYRMYRIIENNIDGYDTQRTRKPFELEFSQPEINYFLSYFHGYISGCFKVANLMITIQPFLKIINSNLILYGCRDGIHFEEQHETPETFHASIKFFYENYDNTVDVPDVTELIKQIMVDEK